VNQAYELPSFNVNTDQAIPLIIESLSDVGLQVIQSFDLKIASLRQGLCTCPHHEPDQCDCQMVVLLVYGRNPTPTTLVVHGYGGRTFPYIINSPQQQPEDGVLTIIFQALSAKAHAS